MRSKAIKWINNKGLSQGIFWIVFASFFSNLNDTAIRLVGSDLPAMQIAFFRFFFGTLVLLPLMLYKGKSSFVIKNKPWHILRIIVGFTAIACWIYGASQTSLPSITTISFACPILVLPLAYIFLGEKSDWKRLLSVGIGFIGVVIIACFEKNTIAKTSEILFFHPGVVFLFLGAVLFALSDVLNKKMLASENLFSLLFYFCLGTTIISLIPALLTWQKMNLSETFYLFIMGAGGCSILYCILKAAHATEISSLAPYKYVELIISIIMGYLLFNEIIKIPTIIGAGLIIPSALLIAYYEIKKERKSAAKEKEQILALEEEYH